jgi:signal transduction histidine kinase/CheY-like chemotaxis protein
MSKKPRSRQGKGAKRTRPSLARPLRALHRRLDETRRLLADRAHDVEDLKASRTQLRSRNRDLAATGRDLGLARDVLSDRLDAERSENAVRIETARAASEAKDDFLAMLSHELRAPLTPVVVGLGILERACREAGVGSADLFALLHRNLRHEVRLIDDLLDMTALARGKLALVRRPIDLSIVLEDALEQVGVDADDKGVRLVLDLGDEAQWVDGDPDRLVQVFANLLRNAVKFSPEGTTVSMGAERQGDDVVVRVRDAGPGVAPADRERIFARFVQGRGGRPGGLGLGLAIARDIVTAHGGKIDVRSGRGRKGAVFEVRLARAAALETVELGAPVAVSAPAHPAASEGKRILLVEDHVDTGRIVASMLRQAGHEVTLAGSVAAALAHADERVDIVVSDMGLPDGSGLDLMRRLCAERPLAGIALSGYGTDEDVRRSHEAGFQQHLVKPIDVPRLLRAIDELTGPRQARP